MGFSTTFTGIVDNTDNKNNIKTILFLDTMELNVYRNKFGCVECHGFFPILENKTEIKVNGKWELLENNTYIFIVSNIQIITQTKDFSKLVLKKVEEKIKNKNSKFKLSSQVKKKILEITNNNLVDFIQKKDSKEILKNETKLSEDKIDDIFEELSKYLVEPTLINYLFNFNVSGSSIYKIIELYKGNSIKVIQKYPYEVGMKVGINFETCDLIARDRKINPFNKTRIKTMMYDCVKQILNADGSTYTTKRIFEKAMIKKTSKSAYPEFTIPLEMMAVLLPEVNGLYLEKNGKFIKIYLKKYYFAEMKIAKYLKILNTRKNNKFPIGFDMEHEIEDVENEFGVKYSDVQKSAFSVLNTNGVKIITGGPGTGKTTIVNGIINIYKKIYPENEILCIAPTGRASQRITEVTKMEAKTIHKALEFMPFDGKSEATKNEHNQLTADLIILDEMSMVDTEIFSKLLCAIKNNAMLILLGDENQLQSVSSGNVLADLISTDLFEMYRLKEVFRQKGDNTLIDNANNVLYGNLHFTKNDHFKIESFEENKDAINDVVNTFFEFNQDIQILSPTKVGIGGTKNVNDILSKKIQEKLAEIRNSDEIIPEFIYGKTTYHLNDKVIFHQNNYDAGYYNGDIGYIKEITEKDVTVQINDNLICISGKNLNDMTLAYAITIHKSQGSEANNILILLPDTYTKFLNRNMLFTGITRTKKYVKIVYVNNALFESVMNETMDKRKTGLVEKIKKYID